MKGSKQVRTKAWSCHEIILIATPRTENPLSAVGDVIFEPLLNHLLTNAPRNSLMGINTTKSLNISTNDGLQSFFSLEKKKSANWCFSLSCRMMIKLGVTA